MTYSITLSNGHALEHVEKSGSTYIYPGELSSTVFQYNLNQVIESTEEETPVTVVYQNMYLVFLNISNGSTYFTLRPLTAEELQHQSLRADIDYIAMLTGITL